MICYHSNCNQPYKFKTYKDIVNIFPGRFLSNANERDKFLLNKSSYTIDEFVKKFHYVITSDNKKITEGICTRIFHIHECIHVDTDKGVITNLISFVNKNTTNSKALKYDSYDDCYTLECINGRIRLEPHNYIVAINNEFLYLNSADFHKYFNEVII